MSHDQIKQKVAEALANSPYQKAIQKVSLFGSHLHQNQKSGSDIDLLIEFSPDAVIGFFQLSRIQRALEQYLQNEVDLLTPEALSPYFKNDVLKEAFPLYERQ